MSGKSINTIWKVKDLIMVNLDTLLMFEKAFKNMEITFDAIVDDYLTYRNSEPAYQVVPFNKYLFQRAKAIGYFYKTPPIAWETIYELQEASRNNVEM